MIFFYIIIFPINFNLEFVNREGEKERPVMIHRTVLGSMERFMGVLIEHYAGRFPLWLAPIQIKILTIVNEEKIIKYAKELKTHFSNENTSTPKIMKLILWIIFWE